VEGRPLEESELVERARDGDVRAYEELVLRYQGIAMRTAGVVLHGSPDAEDAVQEAFVKAYYALDRFRPGAPFRPWLLRIVANEASNRRRAAGRRVRLAFRLAGEPATEGAGPIAASAQGRGAASEGAAGRPSGGAAPSPEAAVLAAHERTALLTAVNALRDDDRLILGYRFFAGLSEAETAAVLGCAVGTVKSRQSRALRRLRTLLLAADPQEPNDG